MSNPEQEQEGNRRKSQRQRVPNAYYTAGINELKKITLKAQSKKNRNEDEEDLSEEDDRNLSNNARNYQQNLTTHEKQETLSKWLPCIMPQTNKHIKVQIVMDAIQAPLTEPVKHREQTASKPVANLQESQNVVIPSYNSGQISKKSQAPGALNLLSLFEKVIKNVSDEVPSPVKHQSRQLHQSALYNSSNLQQLSVKHQVSNQKQSKAPVLAPPKRVIEEDKDGRILSLKIDKENKTLAINHSKIGECIVPVQVEPPAWTKQEELSEEDTRMVEDFKTKLLLNPAILKSIPIFN